ncbi:MAG: metallophosphoesterase [Desulfatiglans sp.]|jgi:putative phosphoesterase|nr:metallophosphoesterase [Thermodesulfobacteriota bacterium]MEE4353207.1 metallophosphoesterase [Desulfatiglans sp.]
MKIGVLSDTHLSGVTRELEEIYNRYLADTDLILHAGDIVSAELIDFLSAHSFYGVCGNMDPAEVCDRLPPKWVLEVGGLKLGLIHGWGSSKGLEDRIRQEFQDVDAIVYGHSHRPANQVREGILFFNPGTATGHSSAGIHTIGILQVDDTIRGEIITLDFL